MVIWIRGIRLKLTFSHRKLNANFGKFNFFQWRRSWNLEIYRLAKLLTMILTEFFQNLSRLCTYLWGIHSLKSNSAVSRSGYLYGVNQKYFLANAFFLIESITRSFMLNTVMENENKSFANILITFIILFIMKLIAQINILFLPQNWRYLSEICKIKEIIHCHQNLH